LDHFFSFVDNDNKDCSTFNEKYYHIHITTQEDPPAEPNNEEIHPTNHSEPAGQT
jgi:hypothetical protein